MHRGAAGTDSQSVVYNEPMDRLQAIIFDLYGVLGLNGWQAFKARHFAAVPEQWERLRELGQQVDAGRAKESDLVGAIAHATGESAETVRYQFEHTTPNRELLQYIGARLRPSYKVAILSNAGSNVLPHLFTAGELELFDAAVSSHTSGLTKPDPAIFALVCRRLQVAPAHCVFIDDQPRHLAAAASLGMHPILYTSVQQCTQALDEVLEG